MAAATAIRPVVVDKFAVAKDLYFNQPEGFPYENFDPDQVVLPPDDDCGVVSEDDDIAEDDIQDEETGFSTSIGTCQFAGAACYGAPRTAVTASTFSLHAPTATAYDPSLHCLSNPAPNSVYIVCATRRGLLRAASRAHEAQRSHNHLGPLL